MRFQDKLDNILSETDTGQIERVPDPHNPNREEIQVLINPTEGQAIGWLNRFMGLRGLVDGHTGDIALWDASRLVHFDMKRALGWTGRGSKELVFYSYQQIKEFDMAKFNWLRQN